ncbi:Pyridoxal 5'-phosphate synthase subunit snz1 [Coemansia helicoidea]|uniref:Pyridoxal 5'-phosphate synthase subunit snz1 n=1 Tax=Coemansia helicoidea TaxID=1286919 RepID=A0ACC1LH24_9FUNG|nr:Pyridoxal 5'-phosphate synthase subunit snz1 [Coemansia helicoidea]
MSEKKKKDPAEQLIIKCRKGVGISGGVIAIVDSAEKAIIAERYGARGVIVAGAGGLSRRTTEPHAVQAILENVMLPVFARVSIGHDIEAAVMAAAYADGIDESEMLDAASATNIDYHRAAIPAMSCVAPPAPLMEAGGFMMFGVPAPAVTATPEAPASKDTATLDVALTKIHHGVAVLRTRAPQLPNMVGETGGDEDTPNITHLSAIMSDLKKEIKIVTAMTPEERAAHVEGKAYKVKLLNKVVKLQRLPVPFFANGGIVHPLDAAMAMDLGYDGVVASVNVFTADNPEQRMRSLVLATIHYKNPRFLTLITENHRAIRGGAGAVAPRRA